MMSSTTHSDEIIAAATVVPTIVIISLLIIAIILILICYRKRQRSLINLTKHHKESDENSYTSSKHSHESGSKSPDPEYDVIKINPSTDKLEAHFVKSKSDNSSVQSNVLKHEEDWDCGPMYSSVDTNAGSPHKIGDLNINSATYIDAESRIELSAADTTDNIISTDAATENNCSVKLYTKVDIKKEKVNKDHENEISKEFAVNGDEDSDEGSTPPPIPPQTTEMLHYVTVENENGTEKVNT